MTKLEENILKSEILLKIQVTARKVKKLSLEIFPTAGPKNILLLSVRILEQLISRFEFYSLDHLILIKIGILRLIVDLISHIEYSTIKNVTWSIIPAYNMLFKSLLKDTEYIIVPQWEEKYSILNSNLIDQFKEHLETPNLLFEADTPEKTKENIDKILDGIPLNIYLVTYSRMEKLSALHLALLGHEIGHIFASQWIDTHYLDFARETKLTAQLVKIVQEEIENKKLYHDIPEYLAKQNKYIEYSNIIKKNYAELLSDIFGCALFGHTYIIAMYLFASTAGLDKSNWQRGYLSWRFRLQNCRQFLSFVLEEQDNDQRTYDFYDSICSTIDGGSITDTDKIVCKLLIESYKLKENEIFTTMSKYSKSELFIKKINSTQIDAACCRLKHEIIPNAMLQNEVEVPIDFRSILYAIWLVSYKENEEDVQLFSKRIQFYNLLGIKGIELSVEQEEYNDFIKRQSKEKT